MKTRSPKILELAQSWRILVAAVVGMCLGGTALPIYAFGVFIKPLSETFHWSYSAISGWAGFTCLGVLLAAPSVGALADRFGAKVVVLAAIPLLALTLAGVGAIGPHLWLFYLAALLFGCLSAATGAVTYSRTVNSWFRSGRGMALGVMSAGIGLGGSLGPPAVQACVSAYGWRIAFVLVGLSALLPLPLVLAWFKDRRDAPAAASVPAAVGYTLREAVRQPIFWALGTAFLLYSLSTGFFFNLIPFFIESGVSRGRAAAYAGLLGASLTVSRMVTGVIMDHFHAAVVCSCVVLAEALALASFGLFGPRYVVLAIVAMGLGHGCEVNCSGYCTARYFGLKAYGKIFGVFSTVMYLGYGLGPMCFSALHDHFGAYRISFLLSAVLGIATAALFAGVSRKRFLENS
jgi:MFS family permease